MKTMPEHCPVSNRHPTHFQLELHAQHALQGEELDDVLKWTRECAYCAMRLGQAVAEENLRQRTLLEGSTIELTPENLVEEPATEALTQQISVPIHPEDETEQISDGEVHVPSFKTDCLKACLYRIAFEAWDYRRKGEHQLWHDTNLHWWAYLQGEHDHLWSCMRRNMDSLNKEIQQDWEDRMQTCLFQMLHQEGSPTRSEVTQLAPTLQVQRILEQVDWTNEESVMSAYHIIADIKNQPPFAEERSAP